MTVTEAAPETTSLAPGARSTWRSVRVPAIAGVSLLVITIGLAVLAGRGVSGQYDPESYEPAGSRAVAELLRKEGVNVTIARTVADARAASEGATVLVTDPLLVPSEQLYRVTNDAAAVVLIRPDSEALAAVGSGLVPVRQDDTKDREPACDLAAASRAGKARMGGVEYALPQAGNISLCYPRPKQDRVISAPLVQEGRVTVLGSGDALTNQRLDENGNAALDLGLLGERTNLVWFKPSLDDPALAAGGSKPLSALMSRGVKLAMWQLAIAAIVIALWRGRRLGPVVGEPLPVIVRASEATEGLARLYRRAGARHRAATALREAAVRSIAPRFGLSAVGADPRAVTEAVARHTGRSDAEIGDLLFGETPGDDAALVGLADSLDTLAAQLREGRVRD